MSERAAVVAVSGAAGFIGTHLRHRLEIVGETRVVPVERDDFADPARLAERLDGVDAVVHLAAQNRAPDEELLRTNVGLVERLAEAVDSLRRPPHVVFASSTQRHENNAYGRSKREGEARLERLAESRGAPVTVLEIPNVFGPGCRPFYNSVVATFAHLAATGGTPEIQVDRELELVYVWDLAEAIVGALEDPPSGAEHRAVGPRHRRTVSGLKETFESQAAAHARGEVPALDTLLDVRLYGTFLSYLEPERWARRLVRHADDRGSLFEAVRSRVGGQVFFSTTRPGIVRGNHFHSRKLEKFCVVRGEAAIRLRPLGTDRVIDLRVSGETPEVVDIPLFHTHHIENVGRDDLYTLFWSNELFDPEDPDTYFHPV